MGIGSGGLGSKAQPSLHPEISPFMLFCSPFSSIADQIRVNMLECLFCGRHGAKDFVCELVPLNLTIPLEAPYQPRFPGKETA